MEFRAFKVIKKDLVHQEESVSNPVFKEIKDFKDFKDVKDFKE